MKIPAFIVLSFVVLVQAGCKPEKKVTPEATMQEDTTSTSITSSDKTYRGLFVVGKKVLSFRRCDQPDKDLAVIDSTGQMKELYKKVFLHSPAFPYEYVYVEVKGEIDPSDELMKVKEFDSVLTVKKIVTFEQKNYLNSCIPYDFWGLGKDWSLQVSAREGIIVFKDYSLLRAYVFEYFPPKDQNDDVVTYASNNYAAQVSIKSVIRKEECAGDSLKSEFQYSASVLINGRRYSGCAIKGSSK